MRRAALVGNVNVLTAQVTQVISTFAHQDGSVITLVNMKWHFGLLVLPL